MTDDADRDLIFGVQSAEYGESYNAHVLEQYKTYLEMADRISQRRSVANSFFLTINTSIAGLVGYVNTTSTEPKVHLVVIISISAMLLCYIWWRLVCSYRQLNSGKFKVIHQIEGLLPLKPYDAEWIALGKGEDKSKYVPFSVLESKVPILFGIFHFFLLASSFPVYSYLKDFFS
jgi:hypothetical protein